jgi:hypothetical protein
MVHQVALAGLVLWELAETVQMALQKTEVQVALMVLTVRMPLVSVLAVVVVVLRLIFLQTLLQQTLALAVTVLLVRFISIID